MILGKLGLVFDEDILPKCCGTSLWQRVNVPVKQEGVGFFVRSKNE
jgi:hypothetical protein